MSVDDGRESPAEARTVRRATSTFKPRRRRLSAGRRADLARWLDRWGVDVEGPPLSWADVFADVKELSGVALDIGFGHGESVGTLARHRPEIGVIAVEVHTAGVATLLEAVEREGLGNVRTVHGDAIRFLDRVPARSLDLVQIYFPDPWPKAAQQHRRFVRDDTIAALTDRLRRGGVLRLATDVADYAEQMIAACDTEPRLAGGVVDDPGDRPLTRFERRGLDEGRTPLDLRYERIDS
jgi:tRNA (guanine-N7-)-methyltransferase